MEFKLYLFWLPQQVFANDSLNNIQWMSLIYLKKYRSEILQSWNLKVPASQLKLQTNSVVWYRHDICQIFYTMMLVTNITSGMVWTRKVTSQDINHLQKSLPHSHNNQQQMKTTNRNTTTILWRGKLCNPLIGKLWSSLGTFSRAKSSVFFNIVQTGGGVKPMFKNFCCKFGIILEAIWQYKLT